MGYAGTRTVTSSISNTWRYRIYASAYFNPAQGFGFLGSARYFMNGTGTTPFANTTSSGYRQSVRSASDYGPQSASGMVPITFSDVLVNSRRPTNGLLEVRAFSTSKTSHTVRLVRLVFNTSSTATPTGTGTTVGSPAPEFSRSAAAAARSAAIAALNKQISALNKKLRKAKQDGKTSKALAFGRKIRALKLQVASL